MQISLMKHIKKKFFGTILIAVGTVYFIAAFCYTDFFEIMNEIVSYLCFISAVVAVAVGTMLLLFQKPEEYAEEQSIRKNESKIIKENSCCRPLFTYILIGVNMATFLFINILQGANSVLDYAVSKNNFAFYGIIAAMFVHVDIEHLAFNMAALFICGKRLEALVGSWRFTAVYLLSGISASVAVMLFSTRPCVGASGAIFGIFVCFLLIAFNNRKIVKYTFWNESVPVACINSVMTFLLPNISVIAHMTGIVFGIVSYLLWCRGFKLKQNCI